MNEGSKEVGKGKSSFGNEMLGENRCAELSRYKMMALERFAERTQWLPGELEGAILYPMVPSIHITTRTLPVPDRPLDSMEPESSMNNHYRITLIAVGIMHARLLTLVFQDGYNGGTISSKPPSYATRGIARFRPPSGQGYELIIVSVAATYDGCDSRPSDCRSSRTSSWNTPIH